MPGRLVALLTRRANTRHMPVCQFAIRDVCGDEAEEAMNFKGTGKSDRLHGQLTHLGKPLRNSCTKDTGFSLNCSEY
jgi:hypothetical protein